MVRAGTGNENSCSRGSLEAGDKGVELKIFPPTVLNVQTVFR